MIKMLEIRKKIQSAIKAVHPRVYYQHAIDTAVYPYIVFDLPNSFDEGSLVYENFVLDVDGYDDSTDSIILETLMDTVDKALHRKSFIVTDGTEVLSMTIYRDNRLNVDEDDSRIRRKMYIYQVRTHSNI